MLLDIGISSRTRSLELPRLIVVSSSLHQELASSRLVFLRMDKPESMLFWLTHLESSSSLLLSTRWTPLSLHTARQDLKKSRRKFLVSSRRSDTTLLLFHSSPFLDGMETTCCKPAPTCLGTRDGMLSARKERPAELPSLKPSIPSFHHRDQRTSPSDYPFRMFTKLEVLEQSQLVVLKLVSSNPVWLSPLPLTS